MVAVKEAVDSNVALVFNRELKITLHTRLITRVIYLCVCFFFSICSHFVVDRST